MRIVIVGPGALGCLLGSLLHQSSDSDQEVCLLDYNAERATVLQNAGIVYDKAAKQQRVEIPVYSAPEKCGIAQCILLCVKSYDLQKSLSFCKPLLREGCLIVFTQNGISHLDFGPYTLDATPAYATTTEGATSIAPGHVHHAGSGHTFVGFLQPQHKSSQTLLENLAGRLNAAGIITSTSENILLGIWNKLIINVGINALTVLYNCKNGELLENHEALMKMEQAIDEAILVAAHLGIHCFADPFEHTMSVCRSTADNISSMLQDVRKGRKTEISAINGAICQLGREHGIPTPVNDNLVQEITRIEQK